MLQRVCGLSSDLVLINSIHGFNEGYRENSVFHGVTNCNEEYGRNTTFLGQWLLHTAVA